MSTLKLWAIGIDDVRNIFGADAPLAERLRTAAQERFGTAASPPPGLLGKLGPLLRGAGDPAAPRPGVPHAEDVEDLLSGKFIAPHRLEHAWNLLEFWLDTLSVASGRWSLSESGLNDFDFDLVRAGVSARYGISDLFKASLGISLTRCPGLAAGWVTGSHARAMHAAWPDGLSELSAEHRQLAEGLLGFLADFDAALERAQAAGDREPDLVAIFRA